MNFKNEMQNYFKIRTLEERKKKILDILSQLEKMQKLNDPTMNLNMAEVIIEYCLLIENNDERLLQYERALELVQNSQHNLKEKKQIEELLRSYHLECLISYHTMKYKDEEESIQNMFNLGGTIQEIVIQSQGKSSSIKLNNYYSLGYAWRAYGLILLFIHTLKELSLEQKHDMLKNARELAHKARELALGTKSRDAHIISSYVFAFIEQLPPLILRGDNATTEADFIEFMLPYDTLYKVAHAYNSVEFEYLALLNHARLNLLRVIYAAGVSERKKEMFSEILADCEKLEEYENLIRLPHLHLYLYEIQIKIYTSIVYFEVVKEEKFNYYIDEAIKFAEKMKDIYVSARMKGARDKVEVHHLLNEVYRMKASFATSRKEKIENLKKCEELLLDADKISAAWSLQVYSTWRDLSSIYLDLSKEERNPKYLELCVFYAKKAYESALTTKNYIDALFETYKIAMITEDYQDYPLSIEHYELAHNLIDKILQAGKDYPYYHDLKIYLKARLLGVQAKEFHRKGKYALAMDLYSKASSVLQLNDLYLNEGLLYNAYSLFEEASIKFIEEKYKETQEILSSITYLFNETTYQYAEDSEPQFQYFMDRKAYDLQQFFFESSKTFCLAQSNILQSLIYRNTGDSEKAVELLKEANSLLEGFRDRDIHIAGYHSFTNGLFGLEQSELAIRESDYKGAAAYLASASDQFETASQILTSDERLSQLCEGLKSFCQGWMYALEIMRRHTDLTASELNSNFKFAHQAFVNASKSLKVFKKTFSSAQGFEKLLEYIHYSILFQKTEDSIEKEAFRDMMICSLNDALRYFKDAEDKERYGFTRDLLINLPQLETIRDHVFKPIDIPFTPYTPVFDTTTKIEPSGVNCDITLDKPQVEVNEKIRYTIQISSVSSIYIKRIEGVFPKKGVKVLSGIRLAKKGMVEVESLLSPGQSIVVEFTIQALKPLYSRKNPQLIYYTMKNEKFRTFTKPFTLQVYPKDVLKTSVVSKFDEKVRQVKVIMDQLGIVVGEFPIIYHNLDSYREILSDYLIPEEDRSKKRSGSKKNRISKLPIKQMAFVNPLGEVNILYDLKKYIYPQSIISLLNIIIHEKFGHSYFYQHTTLGKKLLELEYHRKGIALLMKELARVSDKYTIGLQWLFVSTLVVNEGFSVWLTLKTLRELFERAINDDYHFAQQISQEMEIINKRVLENDDLNVKHEYFTLKYEKPVVNPYATGYDLFSQIEESYGEKCVPVALKIVSDISLTRRQISRMLNTVKNDKNCADKRLEKIVHSNLKIERNKVDMFENVVKKLLK